MKKTIIKLFIGILVFFITTNVINAATGTITISGASSMTTGSTISVTVRASASKIFYWQFFTTYDTTILQLISGATTIQGEADDAVSGVGGVSRTYKFKAIKTGTAYVRVTAGSAGMNINTDGESISYATKTMNISINNPAPKSTNNYMSALLIDNATIAPTFDKNILEYTTTLEPLTTSINIKTALEDPKAKISGAGVVTLVEGLNTINLVVTAESGAIRTYKILATVLELKPILVKIGNKDYTIIRKTGLYEPPVNFEETTIKIDGEDVLAYINKKLKLTLVGLKDDKQVIKLYTYDGKEYKEYKNITINGINLYLKTPDRKLVPRLYKEASLTINDTIIDAYNFNNDKNNYLVYGINTLNGQQNFYSYDKKGNTLQIYYDDYGKALIKTIDNYKLISLSLSSVSIILLLALTLFAFRRKKIKKKKKLEEQ